MEHIFKLFVENCWKIWEERTLITLHRPIFIAFALVVALAAGGIVGFGEYVWLSATISSRDNELRIKNATIEGLQNKPAATSPIAAPSKPTDNIFRSTQYKENLSNRLDRISKEINKTDEGMLIPANQVLTLRFLVRPAAEAGEYLTKLDGIKAATKRMQASLYDDLLASERDYRVELNRTLFPREPFDNFMRAVDDYRNSVSVWMKFSNNAPDDQASQELRQSVAASANSFSRARDEFVKWLSQRQDLIGQARRELHE